MANDYYKKLYWTYHSLWTWITLNISFCIWNWCNFSWILMITFYMTCKRFHCLRILIKLYQPSSGKWSYLLIFDDNQFLWPNWNIYILLRKNFVEIFIGIIFDTKYVWCSQGHLNEEFFYTIVIVIIMCFYN